MYSIASYSSANTIESDDEDDYKDHNEDDSQSNNSVFKYICYTCNIKFCTCGICSQKLIVTSCVTRIVL